MVRYIDTQEAMLLIIPYKKLNAVHKNFKYVPKKKSEIFFH